MTITRILANTFLKKTYLLVVLVTVAFNSFQDKSTSYTKTGLTNPGGISSPCIIFQLQTLTPLTTQPFLS